ncbi:MAG: fumarylacetoacetate hydrolase family protein [Actinobacteria bacterium]|nr:fumarylacetoacetate hydrolase family protein [Actinomycetota bacterium]MBV9935973.1 fumarylacetoacetate hydrolase family protein [Actinomycetota bacterium]
MYIARLDASGDTVVPVYAETQGPGRDGLREALAAGVIDGPAVADERPLADVRLLAPVINPQKVLAIGLNYAKHAREGGIEPPKSPVSFVKTNNSIVGPDDEIRYSKDDSTQVDYEVELAVVMGRTARRVSTADALDYVLGYTVCNDVSARDAQFGDGQWVRSKSFDTFCPLGPSIVTTDEIPDPQTLGLRCRVNGTTLQDSNTADMIFGCAEIISFLSRAMTLEPGDVIATGTPEGVGFARKPPVWLLDGDVVECEVDGIGVLRNQVVVD